VEKSSPSFPENPDFQEYRTMMSSGVALGHGGTVRGPVGRKKHLSTPAGETYSNIRISVTQPPFHHAARADSVMVFTSRHAAELLETWGVWGEAEAEVAEWEGMIWPVGGFGSSRIITNTHCVPGRGKGGKQRNAGW
jgi:hypothetical protein